MYSLRLVCPPAEIEKLSFDLWEAGTVGIREMQAGERAILLAGFDLKNQDLDEQFAAYQPEWQQEDDTDWEMATRLAWPGRHIGQRIFLAPIWNVDATPVGRIRVIHNPGLASGTGEHSCTQLAMAALERWVSAGAVVADIGTGSGILAIAALRLGAQAAIALDMDEAALATARENFELNKLSECLIAGSADCLASATADLVVANISGTVLIDIADELLRVLRHNGVFILTGFPESELAAIEQVFGCGDVTALNEWRCLSLRVL